MKVGVMVISGDEGGDFIRGLVEATSLRWRCRVFIKIQRG